MKTLLLILLLLPAAIVHAQKNRKEETSFFVFDENWKACKIEDAKYLSALEKLSDTAYELKTYISRVRLYRWKRTEMLTLPS